ncbi:MAG: MBOAT family O-acyltransferase [Polaribacter sp.]|uniref:MBOAT family O-acyltransferase n=1 Tax=Polaribacter sp. TaxID=1920175 RepID=UPI003267A18C
MLFNSIDFAFFFPIVFVLYWIVAKNLTLRNVLILFASYIFYGWWDVRFLLLIILSSFVDFIVGKQIFKNKHNKKSLLGISLLVNLGFLFYFKYTNFFIESFVDTFTFIGKKIEISTLNIILPVGISFYTFQTLSYTIDIYRDKLKPTNNWLAFFSFVSFFPQLVAGPIERASHLLPQFYKTYKFDYNVVKSGFFLVAFGLFKKMVIADRAAILVNQVYNNPSEYSGVETIIATILFAFQIYCDFSAYSDIAIGVARTMGFDLMKNFKSPYFSKSITEFWKRWHISLSTWFRDYVYIPLGGNKNGKYRTYVNLFIVFVISGLWHGAAITFLIWGVIHGLIIVLEKSTNKVRINLYNRIGLQKNTASYKLLFSFITFCIVCFAWIFFRANNYNDAVIILSGLTDNNYIKLFTKDLYKLGLVRNDFVILIVAIFSLLFFEIINNRKNIEKILSRQPLFFRWIAYLLIVFILIFYGVYGDSDTSQFIYFQF